MQLWDGKEKTKNMYDKPKNQKPTLQNSLKCKHLQKELQIFKFFLNVFLNICKCTFFPIIKELHHVQKAMGGGSTSLWHQ
jgi:hypothetical protein